MSTSVTNLRKIQNEDAEKCKVFKASIEELRLELKEKDEIISKLKWELKTANHLLNLRETEKINEVVSDDRQLKELTIESNKVLIKLKNDVLALHDKLNVNSGKNLLLSAENFKVGTSNENKDLDIIKPVHEQRRECGKRFTHDEIRNLDSELSNNERKKEKYKLGLTTELQKVDDRGAHAVKDINTASEPERALLATGANFPPKEYNENHKSTAQWEITKRRRRLRNERQLIPSAEQKRLVSHTVLMIFGLDEATFNTDKVFNLVCLYGNVERIRIIQGKRTTMVQMADYASTERCVKALHNTPIGNNGRIETKFSRKTRLSDQNYSYLLPDHTPCYKNYSTSDSNRFLMPLVGDDINNQPMPPTKFLFFFNTPSGIKETDLRKLFNSQGIEPKTISILPLQPEQQSSSGIIEFLYKDDAVVAIMKCNHMAVENRGSKFPSIMKLRFHPENMATNGLQHKKNLRI